MALDKSRGLFNKVCSQDEKVNLGKEDDFTAAGLTTITVDGVIIEKETRGVVSSVLSDEDVHR
jgi:hypothetical protein